MPGNGHTERPDDIRRKRRSKCRIQSGGMDIREAGIQCREMDIRRGRMTSGGKEEANARFNPAEKKKGEIENPPLRCEEGEFLFDI